MPSTCVYIDGNLEMPNGSVLWAEDIDLEVEYEIERGYDDPRLCDVDFTVVGVFNPITATDTSTNAEVVLHIDATHPALRKLVKQKSREIEDYCLDAAQFEDA